MLTITGSHPVLITYTDGSSHEYSLDDPVLLAAVEFVSMAGAGEPVPTLEHVEGVSAETPMVDFATVDWPADAVITLHGEQISLQDATDRLAAFIGQAVRNMVGRA